MNTKLKRSKLIEGGVAKPPEASQIDYGQIAINYSQSDPCLFIKDENDDIIRITGNTTAPISFSNGNIGLNINKGLEVNSNDLEVKLGSRMKFDNNGAIASDAPLDAVDVFSPIVIVNPSTFRIATARNPYTTPTIWTGTFTIPDGCNEFALVSRGRIGLLSTTTNNVLSTYSSHWVSGVAINLTFTGNGFTVTEDQEIKASLPGLSQPPVENRWQSSFVMRMNLLTCSGSGNRVVNYSGYGYWGDAQGSGDCQVDWGGLNLLIQPIES